LTFELEIGVLDCSILEFDLLVT